MPDICWKYWAVCRENRGINNKIDNGRDDNGKPIQEKSMKKSRRGNRNQLLLCKWKGGRRVKQIKSN